MRFQPSAFLGTLGELSITQTGLVFDFQAEDYVSGSTNWNAAVGGYTASVTGTLAGGLKYIDGTKVGFDGDKYLEFPSSMTASISSSKWQVYALVEFNSSQLLTSSFKPSFFSKGNLGGPAWNWWYEGGNAPITSGEVYTNGYINSVTYTEGGMLADKYNKAFLTGSKQLFAFEINGSDTGSLTLGRVTQNADTNIPGNSTAVEFFSYGLNSFTGSASDPLLFGKATGGFAFSGENISGSVVRLFAYNRILTSQERKNNWFVLTSEYIP